MRVRYLCFKTFLLIVLVSLFIINKKAFACELDINKQVIINRYDNLVPVVIEQPPEYICDYELQKYLGVKLVQISSPEEPTLEDIINSMIKNNSAKYQPKCIYALYDSEDKWIRDLNIPDYMIGYCKNPVIKIDNGLIIIKHKFNFVFKTSNIKEKI